jgi:hypothetical protein
MGRRSDDVQHEGESISVMEGPRNHRRDKGLADHEPLSPFLLKRMPAST